jgi:hypothetical protein
MVVVWITQRVLYIPHTLPLLVHGDVGMAEDVAAGANLSGLRLDLFAAITPQRRRGPGYTSWRGTKWLIVTIETLFSFALGERAMRRALSFAKKSAISGCCAS